MREITFLQAIQEAQREEMRRDPHVFIMGEDLRTNLFGATGGFVQEFGLERILSTPLSENGFTGAAAGAAMVGMRPIVDYTIAPFMYCAMDQLVSIIAKSTYLYRWPGEIAIGPARSDVLWALDRRAAFGPPPSNFYDDPGFQNYPSFQRLRYEGPTQDRDPG